MSFHQSQSLCTVFLISFLIPQNNNETDKSNRSLNQFDTKFEYQITNNQMLNDSLTAFWNKEINYKDRKLILLPTHFFHYLDKEY